MKRLKELNQYLLSLDWFAEEQLNTWCEEGSLQISSKLGENGMIVAYNEYSSAISVEAYKGSANRLFAAVVTWLINNDCDRDHYELPDPTYQVFIIDNETVDIDIDVKFIEEVHLVEKADGPFQLHEKRWDFAGYQADVAEELSVDA
jgi:hypothetical protein